MKLSFTQKALVSSFKSLNRVIAWHRLTRWVGIINLLSFRYELRAKNFHDTYLSPEHQGDLKSCPFHDPKFHTIRNSDGKFNDLQQPLIGCTGMRFGRNMPREFTVHTIGIDWKFVVEG